MKLFLLALLCVTAWCDEDSDHDHDGGHDHDHEHDGEIADCVNWNNKGIVNTAEDQQSCGGCWAFVSTGILEAEYALVTGELIKLSDQYFIDCQFPYDGCAGGSTANALQKLEMTQFIPSAANYPWTGYYSGSCKEHPQSTTSPHTNERNALKDVWVTYHSHISSNEEAVLTALQDHPIALGYVISDAMGSYHPEHHDDDHDDGHDDVHDDHIDDDDIFEDKQCLAEARGHASVLVGYTDEAWILKQSWGKDYGMDGYTYLKRGDTAIRCNFFKDAVDIHMIKRREIEYKNWGKMHNYADAKKRCAVLDKKTGRSGWTLAVIPTRMHLDQVKALHIAKWGAQKKAANYNIFWIGLNLAESGASTWADGFTKLGYSRFGNDQPELQNRAVAMSKISGKWSTEKSNTKLRIVCSRYVTCPTLRVFDIPGSESIVFGGGNAALAAAEGQSADAAVEGATVTVTCKPGYHMHGAAEGSCAAGVWALPECEDEDHHDDK